MAKDKDDVTPEVTTPATTRPGFSTQVAKAPDHNTDEGSVPQRVRDELDAGRASLQELAGTSAAISSNPADRDPAHAAEVANAMNAEHAEHDLWEANKKFLPEGETDPGEVPSRGYVYEPLPGEENTQGTAAYKTTDPRYQDPDSDLGRKAEGLRLAREAEEARVKETVARANDGSGGNERREPPHYTEKIGQQRDSQPDRSKTKK